MLTKINRFECLRFSLQSLLFFRYNHFLRFYLFLNSFLTKWILCCFLTNYSLGLIVQKSEFLLYIVNVLKLSTFSQMTALLDLVAVDFIGKKKRWLLVYQFGSLLYNFKIYFYLYFNTSVFSL